jgi:hypothetical protein
MFLTCLGCSGQKYALIPDQSAPHNVLADSLPIDSISWKLRQPLLAQVAEQQTQARLLALSPHSTIPGCFCTIRWSL